MLERIDRYSLKERIGVGGQATVYLGEDTLQLQVTELSLSPTAELTQW